MENTMRSALALAALLASLAPLAAQAADPITLKLASPAPPMSQVNTWGLTPWLEEVQKASAGSLEIKMFPGPALATFDSAYDRTINGVTEIAFGVFGPYAGQFKGTDAASMPYMTDSNVEASVALWRLVSSGLIADEFSRIRPLALFTFPSSGIHTNKEIKTADDLKGLKIGVFSRAAAHESELLGLTPITMTPSDHHDAFGCVSIAAARADQRDHGGVVCRAAVQAAGGDRVPPRGVARPSAGLRLHEQGRLCEVAGRRQEGARRAFL
jgi:TRAP-type C4-dicarboxylate transport system substrate-binding protein